MLQCTAINEHTHRPIDTDNSRTLTNTLMHSRTHTQTLTQKKKTDKNTATQTRW